MEANDYEKLVNKEILKITKEYRYHPEIKQKLNEAIVLVLIDPQQAYESVIMLKKFELKEILENNHYVIDYMSDQIIEHLEYLFVSNDYVPNVLYMDIMDEFDEIQSHWANSKETKQSQIELAAELEFFYYERIIPLFN